MGICIVRTVTIYIILIAVMRLTGKRQIGELETSELVSTIMISEIAASPVTDLDIPLLFAIVPIIIIVSLEVIISFSVTRSNLMKKVFIGTPSVIVKKGKLQLEELSKARMSLEELLCELRVCGVPTLEDVDYAILESNGKLSVTLHARANPATLSDLGIGKKDGGIAHAVIIDGVIKEEALAGSGKDERWLNRKLKESKLKKEDVFLLSVDDAEHIYIIKRKDVL